MIKFCFHAMQKQQHSVQIIFTFSLLSSFISSYLLAKMKPAF